MTNLKEITIRSEAARIGFFKKSIAGLSGIVRNNINEAYIKAEKKLSGELAGSKEKSTDLNKRIENLELKYKQSPFNIMEFTVGLLGISLMLILIYTGQFIAGELGVLLIGLGFTGSLLISLHKEENPFWRPILFTALSILGAAIIFSALRENNRSMELSIISGAVTGLNVYILNSIIITSIKFIIKQAKTVLIAYRSYLNSFRLHRLLIKENKTNQQLIDLNKEREIEYNKINNLVALDYMIGQTAREIKTRNLKKKISSVSNGSNGKEYIYAR